MKYLSVLQMEVADNDPMNANWHNLWRGALNYNEVDGLTDFLWGKKKEGGDFRFKYLCCKKGLFFPLESKWRATKMVEV